MNRDCAINSFEPFTNKSWRLAGAAVFGTLTLAVSCASGQAQINSAVVLPRVYNDIPGAVTAATNAYPSSITLSESGVSSPTGFCNRDVWRFSSDGTNAYTFQPHEYFSVSFKLTLRGSPITPRKEAGLLFSTGSNGDVQFIVNTDGHEVVQFGGISFYSFNVNNNIRYNSGDTITLGMSYYFDGTANALRFSANGVSSPIFEFGPTVGSGALDIGTGSTLGGYFQIVDDPGNPSNSGTALFQNISFTAFAPRVDLIKAVKPSFSCIMPGTNYQLQVSADPNTWTNSGSVFTATGTNMVYPRYFDVDNWDRLFFRLQVAP